ncbi:unnamed protein product [Closterium sp. NIES-54]
MGFLLAALVDMGEVSSSYGLALLHRCCASPHAALRLTAVDALSSAPSLSALGNAGCAVLQVSVGVEVMGVVQVRVREWCR